MSLLDETSFLHKEIMSKAEFVKMFHEKVKDQIKNETKKLYGTQQQREKEINL